MSKNKRLGDSSVVKTFKFKVLDLKNELKNSYLSTISEYTNYYNAVSSWICNNWLTMKLGDCLQYITVKEGHEPQKYFTICEENSDKFLYNLFDGSVSCDGNSRCNILYSVIHSLNPESYKGNLFGLTETAYRRNGYFNEAVSNLVTKMTTVNPKIKSKRVDEDSDNEIIMEQCVYEMFKRNYSSLNDFDGMISYLNMKENVDEKTIKRFTILRDYFALNESSVKEKYNELCVKTLTDFGGCVRKSDKFSMKLQLKPTTISRQDEKNCRYVFSFMKSGKRTELILMGNKQVIYYDKNTDEITELVDIENTHGEFFTFIIEKGKLYVALTCDSIINKPENDEVGKPVGTDVNTKHMLLSSSIEDDGKVIGYVNIYKELMNNSEFLSTLNLEEKEYYKEISNMCCFGLIEYPSLIQRIYKESGYKYDENLLKRDEIIVSILKSLIAKYSQEKDYTKVYYLNAINKMRKLIKSVYKFDEAYKRKQQEYDIAMGYVDSSTMCKNDMDSRRSEYPFIDTDIAKDIIEKRNNISADINGCRDEILRYAYRIYKLNGYKTVGLEKLESSQFEKEKYLPTVQSMLKFHKLLGKTIEEAKSNSSVGKLVEDGYYEMKTDSDGLITGMSYSDKAKRRMVFPNFFNNLIKHIHFADAKDEFIKLTNDGEMNVVLVPSQYTSQMDSITHKIYTVEKTDKKGKKSIGIADKKKVRTSQERHINGLNADYNAALNIRWIAENEEARNMFCTKNKTKYGIPLYDTKVKSGNTFIDRAKKLGLLSMMEE